MIEYQKILLGTDDSNEARMLVPENIEDKTRPAMLCVPGGGYGGVCMDTEGYPLAERFEKLGFRPFILNYRVAPHRYPEPQQDILKAIRLLRFHAKEWDIFPDNITICGFSAGGHLCASAGVFFDKITPEPGDETAAVSSRPDAVILCYPVISSGPFSHAGSFRNLLGEDCDRLKDQLSLENYVQKNSPPMFVWHTIADQVVPFQNSVLMTEALVREKIPAELHLFPYGPHGMTLGCGREDIARWPEMAVSFLRGTLGFRLPVPRQRTVVLTFDDCSKTHIESVVPILKKYGFHATFFFCRFNDEWRSLHESTLMTQKDAKKLCDDGFEIGNHTWNHPDLRKLSGEEIGMEFDRMEAWLREAGCPPSVSFAYPGGPYAENAVKVLKARGVLLARTTEESAWTQNTDPMRVPSVSLSHDEELTFYRALQYSENDGTAVLLYHGIPDTVHPRCSSTLAFFEKNMDYLYKNGYRVLSMKELMQSRENS